MNNLAEQYSKMVECATELADFFLDQKNGAFTLTIVCEILQVLLQSGELSAAGFVIESIFQLSEIEFPLEIDTDVENISFNLEQYMELLSEILEIRLES